jgi:hypothetical protein
MSLSELAEGKQVCFNKLFLIKEFSQNTIGIEEDRICLSFTKNIEKKSHNSTKWNKFYTSIEENRSQ